MNRLHFARLFSVIFVFCLLTGCAGQASDEASAAGGNPGTVAVSLSGGSGRASVVSPAPVRAAEGGGYVVSICWSSPSYDFMIVDGVTYYPVNESGNSEFELPIPALDCILSVQADTTAMSTPHLIDYVLSFGSYAEQGEQAPAEPAMSASPAEGLPGMSPIGELPLQYAEGYTVTYYEGGLSLISLTGGERFLLAAQAASVPESLPEDIVVLQQPLADLYLVSSGAMDMFAACGAMDSLSYCALQESGWYVPAAQEAMRAGRLVYAGKYSAPDYELLCAGGSDLAIENAMILHTPEVAEELESLGIPVMIERSSYESTPQGRMEWVKLFGLLTSHLDEAEAAFAAQLSAFEESAEATGMTAAFFYLTQNGTVSVRNSSDYIPALIAGAGGTYLFPDIGTDASGSTTVIQMEEFYAAAKDADYLIYNSSIAGQLETLDDFLALSPLFANLKAVREGHVYCTAQNLYQSSMELGDFLRDLRALFHGSEEGLTYLYRLQ